MHGLRSAILAIFRKCWDCHALFVWPSKMHHSIWKIPFVSGADEWKAKLESAYSFELKYSKITVCVVHLFEVDNPMNNPSIGMQEWWNGGGGQILADKFTLFQPWGGGLDYAHRTNIRIQWYKCLKSLAVLDFWLDWSDVSRSPIRHQIQFCYWSWWNSILVLLWGRWEFFPTCWHL